MKLQLRQAGCDPGDDSGIWDKKARRALEEFRVHARMDINIDTPSLDALKTLQGKEGRVCPLVCGAGTRKEGDRCVVIKPKSDDKGSAKTPAASRSASGGGSAAELLARCRSRDRSACMTLCSLGFNGVCQKMNLGGIPGARLNSQILRAFNSRQVLAQRTKARKSALGQEQTCALQLAMSALHSKADIPKISRSHHQSRVLKLRTRIE